MEKKYTLALVSHTHWDREWYLPFQEFRIRLVRMTDKLLKILDTDPDFKTFVFDGQTIVLDDYLEIRPSQRERIAKYVRSGRLRIGPWYILPDEFLVSAEATVRNLLLGHLSAEEFGEPMRAGYVPDPFGHISQMPQIMRGFGIDSFFFSRGLGLEKEPMTCEFKWRGPDGSEILAVNQPGSYCSACNLGYTRDPDETTQIDYDLAVEQLASHRDKLTPKCATSILLLNNGCDHLDAQPEIPEIIRRANDKLEDSVVVHTSFDEVAKMIWEQRVDLPTYTGELRAGKYMPLLPGVLSTRMYIKQANERTQTLLEKWTEPFSALAYAHGKHYENEFIWLAWKLCMQNHPHDSICGCSIDQVHREMMPRFDQSRQIGEAMAAEGLSHIASQVNTVFRMPETATPAIVFNALNWEVQEPVTVRMSGLLEHGKPPGQFVVRDSAGNILPSQVSNPKRTELHRHGLWADWDVSFVPGVVPSLGYKAFSIDKVEFKAPGGQSILAGPLVASENAIENDFVKVTVFANGQFDLLDKATGNLFQGCNLFEDTEDAGDEYDYSKAKSSRMITSTGAQGTVSLVDSGEVFATLRVDTELRLPAGLAPDRYTRSSEGVPCPITVLITVRRNSPRVDIVTEVTNNAKDHRLRAWFPAGVASGVSQTEGQYDVVERPIELPDGKDWWQRPQPELPQQSFVNVQGEGRGLTVINQGLPECEVMRPADAIIALTLLRCCQWLSTADLSTRDSGAGPEIPTPDAQCLGKHTFSYAVLPHAGDWQEAKVWRQAHQHNVPLRAMLTSVHPGKLPAEQSFLSVSPENLVISAIKKSDRDESVIVRVYNTTAEEVRAELRTSLPIKSATLANLNEEAVAEAPSIGEGGNLSFSMPGFRVQTLRMSL